MFAQLLITTFLVLAMAEALSRWLLGKSLRALFEEALAASEVPTPAPSKEGSLEVLVRERREALAAARRQVRLANRAASVTDELTTSADRLVVAEERLADAERRLANEFASDSNDETRVLG